MTAEVIDQPPLLVRLSQSAGKPPGGLSYALPSNVAEFLLRHRLAVPVGDMSTFADVTITDEEWLDSGMDVDTIHAMLTSS